MKKNSDSRKSRVQKTDDAAVVDEKNGDSPDIQMTTDAETRLEARFIKAQTNLSSSRKRLMNRILGEPHESFFLSSREMARRYGVDSSTIVRTIQALGYEKFADFSQDLRNHFVTQITPYTSLKAAAQKNSSVADYVHQSVEQDLENLNALKTNLN
ncbi:MAG TPA: hypothetical protein VK892_07880, partial [Pyrinomonadaceae bacterium]|nr:hypothetical protein [Pyrinomonadaceae bacterium]